MRFRSHQRELIINRQGLDPPRPLGIMKLSISGPSGVLFFLSLRVAIPRLLLCILGSYQPRYERTGNNGMNTFFIIFFFLKSNSKLQSYKALLFFFFFFMSGNNGLQPNPHCDSWAMTVFQPHDGNKQGWWWGGGALTIKHTHTHTDAGAQATNTHRKKKKKKKTQTAYK